ncbi:glycosyltransferase family 4 protein [Thiorhodococcus minor]|uniref:Glycosyltransferase family 4 protein n=1 Tax=Thiorhodococcus minor TaxID=57489 RepID=A0A6M0JU89_9GAMM|nr:glycosyltransferase family 1 protein [Thiorhodococcus minor]NEV61096.1 glycosyltransferase family 4 protein [Thiorhodococcus minor]
MPTREGSAGLAAKGPACVAVDLTPVLPGGENGGARVFVLELLRQLFALAPQTHFVLLTQAASHEQLAELDRPNVTRRLVVGKLVGGTLRSSLVAAARWGLPLLPKPLRRWSGRLGYGLHTALKRGGASTRLRRWGVDLLFCPFTAPTYREPGIATVCVLYDLQFKEYPTFFTDEDLANREHAFVEACRRASRMVTISAYSRAVALSQGCADPERVVAIPLRMARRLSCEHQESGRTLADFGLAAKAYLVYPANFWPHKNHVRLLEAFLRARERGLPTGIKLLCTGAPGPGMEALRERARDMGLEAVVALPGYVSDADLGNLMARSAGLVFPSLYEGFGLPVLEAMAAGIPVACSNCTALPEVAGDAAIYFDPMSADDIAQALISLAKDQRHRAALLRAGLARARDYEDARRMADDYWRVFQEAVASARASVTGSARAG